jgi:hypothetical protein
MNKALFALLLFLCVLPSWGEETPPASVEASVDRTEITIGDPVHYSLKIDYANGVEVQKPGWGTGLEGFQILDFDRGTPKKVGERWQTVDEYTLSTFTPEDYTIPPIAIPIKLPSGATEVLQTQPIQIKVASILPEDEKSIELRDLKDPVPVYSGILTGRVLAAAATAIALMLLAWGIWRWRHRPEMAEAAIPPRPEHEVAYDRLGALRIRTGSWSGTPSQEDCKQFGLELSAILREYLERRYGVLALEATSDEIRTFLPMLGLPPPMAAKDPDKRGCEARVLAILEGTDLMKFAKGVQPVESLRLLMDWCEFIVDTTRRPDTAAKEDAETDSPEKQREVA